MKALRDLLAPKSINRVSYVAVVGWIIIGVILVGNIAQIENSEPKFGCTAESENMDLVQETCLEQYEKQNTQFSFPVYAFVILNFFLVGVVPVIYSRLVMSRVNQLLETNLNRDVERQRRPETRRLFVAYCCQLAARFVFGILFIVLLHTQLLDPSNFPTHFNCNLTFAEGTRAVNTSVANIQNTTKIMFECHNQLAKKKTSWMYAVSVVNGLFALIILIETIWILSRAKNGRNIMEDSNFFADHLRKVNIVQSLPQVELQEPKQQDSQNDTNEIPQEPQLASFLEAMKKSIKENTKTPTDLKALFTTHPGEGERTKDLNIDHIYTKLVLHPDRAKYDFPEDREQQLKIYPMPKEADDHDAENVQPKGPEDIIDAKNRKILIVGRPGIGKTLFCTKFLRDWASNRVFNKTEGSELYFDVAFLIKFRKLNPEKSLSLRQLLTLSEYSQTGCRRLPDGVWNYILEHPDKVLLLLDDLDDFLDITNITTETVDNNHRESVEQTMLLAALYSKIMNGELLQGAFVLTTTRPTAASCVRQVPFKRTFEILGFAPEQVEEYVENFTNDAAENLCGAGERIWQHISTNMNLFSLCYIPVNCFIVCSFLLQVMKGNDSTGVGLPTRLTQIYNTVVRLVFFKHNEKYRDKPLTREEIESDNLPPGVETKFKRLGNVAFNGIKERRLTFGSSEVQSSRLENSAFFHQMPDRQIGRSKHAEAQFCFMHLTMQEFLAAKHLTDTMDKEELRRFVSDNIKKGEWQVVLQFVAGLLGERDDQSIEIFTSLLPVETVRSAEITRWLTRSDKYLALTVIKCLYEGSKLESTHAIVQEKLDKMNFNGVDFSLCDLAPADCTALVHVIKDVQQISRIHLYGNHIGSLGCVEIKKLLDSGKSQLTYLNLMHNGIGNEGLAHLSDAIKRSKLTELNLRGNKDITPEAIQRFREDNPNCTVYFY